MRTGPGQSTNWCYAEDMTPVDEDLSEALKKIDLGLFRAVTEDLDEAVLCCAQQISYARDDQMCQPTFEVDFMDWSDAPDPLDACTWHVNRYSSACGCTDWDAAITVTLRQVVYGVDTAALNAEAEAKRKAAEDKKNAKQAAKDAKAAARERVLSELSPEQRAAILGE